MSDPDGDPARSSLPPPAAPPPPSPPPPPDLAPPPAYRGAVPDAPATIAPTGGIGRAIVILLALYVPLAVIALAVQLSLVDKAREFLDGSMSATEFRDDYDSMISITLLPTALTLVIAVLTVMWMFRLARNIQAFGRTGATWAPGWAIGGWLLPPCGIYAIPWLMLRELWKGSDPAVAPGDPTWKHRPVSPLLTVWWILFGLVPMITFASSVSSFAEIDADTTEIARTLDDRVWVAVLDSTARVAAAIVFIVIVRQLTARHRTLTGGTRP